MLKIRKWKIYGATWSPLTTRRVYTCPPFERTKTTWQRGHAPTRKTSSTKSRSLLNHTYLPPPDTPHAQQNFHNKNAHTSLREEGRKGVDRKLQRPVTDSSVWTPFKHLQCHELCTNPLVSNNPSEKEHPEGAGASRSSRICAYVRHEGRSAPDVNIHTAQ